MKQTRDQLVKTQGKMIEAVMTMQEPIANAMRTTLELASGVIGTGKRIAPFDRLLEIQMDIVHKMFDFQLGLVNMMVEAQRDLMSSAQSRGEQIAPTNSEAIDVIDLSDGRSDRPIAVTTTTPVHTS